MNRLQRSAIAAAVLFGLAPSLPAQLDSIVKGILDHVSDQNRQATPTPRPHHTQPRHSAVAEESTPRPPKHPFDGTWLATQTKTNLENQQTISRTFTLIIKDGRPSRTLDTTNSSRPDKPFYSSVFELQRRWSCNAIDSAEQGSSLTVQWGPGQLTDWGPKSIPNSVVQGFGAPLAETSIYKIKGDELTRVNDGNGLVYHRVK